MSTKHTDNAAAKCTATNAWMRCGIKTFENTKLGMLCFWHFKLWVVTFLCPSIWGTTPFLHHMQRLSLTWGRAQHAQHGNHWIAADPKSQSSFQAHHLVVRCSIGQSQPSCHLSSVGGFEQLIMYCAQMLLSRGAYDTTWCNFHACNDWRSQMTFCTFSAQWQATIWWPAFSSVSCCISKNLGSLMSMVKVVCPGTDQSREGLELTGNWWSAKSLMRL